MSFVGYEIDTIKKEVRLPLDKVQKCKAEINSLIIKDKTTLKELQSIIGLLNFACAVIIPGRPFLRRLIDLTIPLKAPHHRRRLTKETKADLNVWLTFLTDFNGKSFFLDQRQYSNIDLNLFTDASGSIGYGAIFGTEWFQGKWSQWWLKQNITLLELYPIVIAIETWGKQLQNKSITIFTDNKDLVSILNDQTSKEPLVMELVRRIVLHCLRINLVLSTRHIAGEQNSVADALSRFQMGRFRRLSPWANQDPTLIPKLPDQLYQTQPQISLRRL